MQHASNEITPVRSWMLLVGIWVLQWPSVVALVKNWMLLAHSWVLRVKRDPQPNAGVVRPRQCCSAAAVHS